MEATNRNAYVEKYKIISSNWYLRVLFVFCIYTTIHIIGMFQKVDVVKWVTTSNFLPRGYFSKNNVSKVGRGTFILNRKVPYRTFGT